MQTLFKSELEKFVAKRASALLILLSVINIVLFDSRWFILTGLVIGAAFSVINFACYAWFFRKITDINQFERNLRTRSFILGITVIVFIKLVLLAVLVWAFSLDYWFFGGTVAGVLLAPLALIINAFTEALGITENHFFT